MSQRGIEVQRRGQTIRGTAYLPEGKSRGPAVLLLHGFTGQRMETGFLYVELGRRLAEAGIAAVTFDFLNSGESDGSFELMLPGDELADALHMTKWLTGQAFADRTRLGLLDFSLGGLLAACTSGQTGAYRSLVLVAPTSPENLCRHAQKEAETTRFGQRVVIGPHILHPDFFRDTMTLDPQADVVKHPLPTLIVQGTEDKSVPPEVSRPFGEAIRAAGGEVETLLVEGANHGFTHPDWRQRLIDGVVGHFGRTL